MRCAPCNMRFERPSMFVLHAVLSHGLLRSRVQRVVNQHLGEAVWLVHSDNDGWFLAVQPPLV